MNNNFKKFFQKKNFIFLTLFLFIALTLVISMPKSNLTQANAFTSGQTTLNWGNRDPNDPKMMPVSFTFNPGTKGYANYGNTVFYQNTYSRDGESFIVYTQNNPHDSRELYGFNFGGIAENWRTDIGNPSMFGLADPYANYNLKKGESPLNSHDYWGDESGQMLVNWGGSLHNWEWRYMGYTFDGTPVENPYFPPDYPDPNWPPAWDVNWTPDPDHYLFGYPSPYANMPERFNWWNDIAFNYPAQGFTAKGDATYWDQMMTFQTNPVLGNGVLMGHIGDPNGWWGYSTWTLASPAVNNLRITKFTILDEDNNQVAEFTQTMDDKNPNPQITKNIPYVKRGKTYKIHAEMADLGLDGNNLSAPISLDYGYGLDSNAWQVNTYDKEFLSEDGQGASHTDGKDFIYVGDYASFDFPLEIPMGFTDDIRLDVKVPFQYYYDGINVDTSDDVGSIILQVVPEDMAMDGNIELYDENGEIAQNILPNKKYTVRFYVDKVAGDTPVGDPSDLANNPYATIDTTITDFATINNNIKASATQTLLPNDVVQIDVPNVSTPSTVLRACAVIDPIHGSLGLNDVPTNDGPVCKTFASEVNLAVSNFKITPPTVLLPYGQSIGSQSLTFNFNLLNMNQDNMTRHARVVLTQGWKIIKDTYVDIPAGIPYNVTWSANVPLSLGSMPFKIKVNPCSEEKQNKSLFSMLRNSDFYIANIFILLREAYLFISQKEVYLFKIKKL